jgi:hypothetical protein
MLLKSATGRNDIMDTMTAAHVDKLLGPTRIAKRAFEAVSKGEMSEFEYGCFQQAEAKRMFPDAPNIGIALSKYFATEAGMVGLAPRRAQSVAENTELMKREGNVPHLQRAQSAGADGDSDSDEDDIATLMSEQGLTRDQATAAVRQRKLAKTVAETIEQLVAKGLTFDQAATVAHRAEKIAKGDL